MRAAQGVAHFLTVTLLCILQPTSTALAEDLVGLVLDNKQAPLPGVRVELVGFGVSDNTTTNGEFKIPFDGSKIGTPAKLQVLKKGWRAKDQAALSLILPRDSATSPLSIDMVPVSGSKSQLEQANKVIRPATNDECLIIVYKFRAQPNHDITANIANILRSELTPGPTAGVEATLSTWRVEEYGKPLGDTGAVALGKKLGALFIITGESDGGHVNLTLTLTERRLLLSDDEMSQIGLRLGDTAISLSAPPDELSSALIPVSVFLRGLQLYLEGTFDSAARHLSKVIERSPNTGILTARASYLRGICYFQRGEFDPAEADYNKAIALGLDVAAVHWRRAQLLIRASKDHDLVAKDLRKGIELSGQSAQAYYVTGLFTYETMLQIHLAFADEPEYFSAADDSLRVAMEKDPRWLAPVLTRVSLHLHYGEFLSRDTLSEVSQFVQAAIQRGGDRPQLRFVLARLYLDHGKANEAIDQYRAALKLGAPGALTHFEIAQAYAQIGDVKNGNDNLKIFLQTKGTEPNQWWLRAVAKAELASTEANSTEPSLFEKLSELDANNRRDKLQAFVSGWIGRTWNTDFLGHKSTEDFLLFALTETSVIPKVRDRNSAESIMHALLGPRELSAESGTPPLWCQADVGRAKVIIVERNAPGRVPAATERVVVYLDRDAKIANDAADKTLLFFYGCRSIATDRRLVFSGD